METDNRDLLHDSEVTDLKLSQESRLSLNTTGKWAGFLAIMGFVSLGILVIFGFSFGMIFSTMSNEDMGFGFPPFVFGLIYLVIGAVYFFPILYLYRFSSLIRKALQNKDTQLLDTAFRNLKAHYKYIGILMIIALGVYVLMFAGMMIGGLMGHMF